MSRPYANRLRDRAGGRSVALCVGLDPSPQLLARRPHSGPDADELRDWCFDVIDAVQDVAAAIKPQAAWFEAVGIAGMHALRDVVEHAREADLLIVLDAKRGDVPHTAAAYARAYLGPHATSSIAADALTIHSAIGVDSLEVFARHAAATSTCVYALVHTSNAGAGAFQQLPIDAVTGEAWWERVAREVSRLDADLGQGVVGAVVGATHPDTFERARQALPTSPLLVPGIGAQGGSLDQLSTLVTDAAAPTLVTISRGIMPPSAQSAGEFRDAVRANAVQYAGQIARISG